MRATDVEARRHARYRVSIPVELAEGHGMTRDISVDGVYFYSDRGFAVGELLEFLVMFVDAPAGSPLRVRLRGVVVRADQRSSDFGVAVRITDVGFSGD